MKNRIHCWLFVSLLLLLVACQPTPRFINHPRPILSVAFDAFDNAGCPLDEYGFRFCTNDSPLKAFGCDEIQEPSSLIGGLDPYYPIAVCRVRDKPNQMNAEIRAEIENGMYFYHIGGVFSSYIRYVILQDSEFHLIKSEDEFRNIFAPIETPEEALSYVLAVKSLSAYYDLAYNPDYEYEIGTIEDTYVISVPNGYKLHLYDYELLGCGPHWTYQVDMQITSQGIIQEIERKQIFRDPKEDGSCAD